MPPVAIRRSSFFFLTLVCTGAAFALPLQAPAAAGAAAGFVPVAGMELLPALARAQDVGPAPAGDLLSVAVSLPFAQPEAAQAFVDDVSNPHSPRYRQFLSPAEVGARFGKPEPVVAALAQYLEQQGFEITLVAQNRLAILARCTVAEAQAAFHTTLRSYALAPQHEYEPASFIACSTPVELPAGLAAHVLDVSGVETYTRPRPMVSLLTPALTRGLYGLNTMFTGGFTGTGRHVGISNFDGFRANDWLLYIAHFALPVPGGGAGSNITVVPCNGGGIGAGPAGGEGDLDIQMALGMAPLASIRIYDSDPNFNLISVLATEVNDNLCDTISESYGWSISTTTMNSAHNQHVSGNAQGITYMAASGDNGTTLDPWRYPAIDPEVLDVGGTQANVNSGSGIRISEVGWSGSGGGWSTYTIGFNNTRPSWQVGTGVPPINAFNNHRLVPDVGFHAAGLGIGAYQFYWSNMLQSGSIGTSFASPMLAGALAVTEQYIISLGGLTGNGRFGRIQDLIYGMNGDPAVWYDVVVGSNGPLPSGQGNSTCGVGWDSVTGWGPMDFGDFGPIAACLTGASCGGGGLGTPYCYGDGIDPLVTTFCPCLNFGAAGRGCANAVNAQGAQLVGAGSTNPDTAQLTSTGELSTSLSIFLQGTTTNNAGLLFGDGVRCVTGALKRLYTHNAVGGSVTAPVGADLPITIRSSQLGDPIQLGTPRYYQTYYRDPNLSFCTGLGFNVSNAVRIDW
jgi:hypothetical protein